MHQSLLETGVDFKLWILCMDDVVFEQLGKMKLSNVELIKLVDFESDDTALAAVKPTRSMVEYCWTISSSLPLYIFKRYPDLDNLAY
jgi:hypothetical protein